MSAHVSFYDHKLIIHEFPLKLEGTMHHAHVPIMCMHDKLGMMFSLIQCIVVSSHDIQ